MLRLWSNFTVDQHGFHAADCGVERANEADGEDGGDVGQPGDSLEGDGGCVEDDAQVKRHLLENGTISFNEGLVRFRQPSHLNKKMSRPLTQIIK